MFYHAEFVFINRIFLLFPTPVVSTTGFEGSEMKWEHQSIMISKQPHEHMIKAQMVKVYFKTKACFFSSQNASWCNINSMVFAEVLTWGQLLNLTHMPFGRMPCTFNYKIFASVRVAFPDSLPGYVWLRAWKTDVLWLYPLLIEDSNACSP